MADFNWSAYASGGATRPNAFSGMNAKFRAALQGLVSSAPNGVRQQLQVYSGYRSPETQAALYNRALQKYGSPQAARQWVAPPGRSQHGKGMAADLKYLSPQAKAWVRENAPTYGLSFPLKNEPWHVELSTARNPNSVKPPMDIPNVSPSMLAYDAVPTPKPQGSPFSALLSPPAPSPSFPATPTPVQREALPDVTPVAFDNSRFGPSPKTGRLAADLPDQLSAFDAARFGVPGTVATTPQQLQRGLLDQQLNAGELPGLLGPATAWPGQTATAYTDPAVTTQPSIRTAAVQAPETTGSISSGLLSPAEAEQVQRQQSLLGGPLAPSSPAQLEAAAARNAQAMQRQNLLGAIGGGLLGGLVLGPAGAIGGGLLGKSLANRNYYPEAPEPQKTSSKNDRSLNSYGKSVSNSSGQFSRAMERGGIGLY